MSRLERLSHFSIILVALVASVAIVDQRIGARRQPSRRNSAGDLIGKQIAIPGVSWAGAPEHVVVAMSTHCPFCEASMPFYRRIAENTHSANAKRTALIFVSSEPADVTSAYLSQQKIMSDKVLSVPLKELNISGTPTLLIVDSGGRVKHAFGGKLPEQNEKIVLDYLLPSAKASVQSQ